MKNLRKLISAILIIALALSLSGCYIVSGQKMRNVKGTYRLTNYSYTPSYERREGYTPTTRDYINGEKYMYEDYLIVTGNTTGYYVHSDASGDSYVKEVNIRYEYDTEDSSKVNYVIHNDSISVNSDEGGTHRLGVTRDAFNYYKSSINYNELFTNRPMATESLSVHWEKVSKATDLSFAEEQLGKLKYYDYASFAQRGIYELTGITEGEEGGDKYSYLFCLIDTARDAFTVTAYYALAGSDETVKKSIDVSAINKDELMQIMAQFGTVSYGGYEFSPSKVSGDITEEAVEQLIEYKLPAEPTE
jgi:hypothetical protein